MSTTDRAAIKTRISTWLEGLRPGSQFTMGDVFAAAVVPASSEYKRRYREARVELEARGWQFQTNGRVHRVVCVGA